MSKDGELPPRMLQVVLKDDGTADARMVPLSELTPEEREQHARAADPASWPEPARRRHEAWTRVVALGPPALGLAEAPLPDEALAVVVREPGPGTRRLVVVGPDAADDAPILLGTGMLRRDEMWLPEAGARRIIHVYADRPARLVSEGRERRSRSPNPSLYNVVTAALDALRTHAASVDPETIDGVGVVRVVVPQWVPYRRDPA